MDGWRASVSVPAIPVHVAAGTLRFARPTAVQQHRAVKTPSSGLPFGSQTIERHLRLAGHAPDDLACRQNLVDVARALSGSQANLIDVAVEIARRQDRAIARQRNSLAVEDRRANDPAFRIPMASASRPSAARAPSLTITRMG